MTRTINYKDTLFHPSNLTPIRGKTTFKTLHKLQNEIKTNSKSVYSNLRGRSHGHLRLLLPDAKYTLILSTSFIWPTHAGPLIIPDGTTDHTNSNMRITHTKELHLFQEVTGVEQALVQKIVDMVEESYVAYIHNGTMNSINDTVANVLTHLQDSYIQLMPHELLEREDIIKKMTHNSRDPIANKFYAVKELLDLADITRTSYTQLQEMNIAYVIVHRKGKFGMAICKCNHILKIQKTWVLFKPFFFTAYQEPQETSDLTLEDASMYHADRVRNIVAGL